MFSFLLAISLCYTTHATVDRLQRTDRLLFERSKVQKCGNTKWELATKLKLDEIPDAAKLLAFHIDKYYEIMGNMEVVLFSKDTQFLLLMRDVPQTTKRDLIQKEFTYKSPSGKKVVTFDIDFSVLTIPGDDDIPKMENGDFYMERQSLTKDGSTVYIFDTVHKLMFGVYLLLGTNVKHKKLENIPKFPDSLNAFRLLFKGYIGQPLKHRRDGFNVEQWFYDESYKYVNIENSFGHSTLLVNKIVKGIDKSNLENEVEINDSLLMPLQFFKDQKFQDLMNPRLFLFSMPFMCNQGMFPIILEKGSNNNGNLSVEFREEFYTFTIIKNFSVKVFGAQKTGQHKIGFYVSGSNGIFELKPVFCIIKNLYLPLFYLEEELIENENELYYLKEVLKAVTNLKMGDDQYSLFFAYKYEITETVKATGHGTMRRSNVYNNRNSSISNGKSLTSRKPLPNHNSLSSRKSLVKKSSPTTPK